MSRALVPGIGVLAVLANDETDFAIDLTRVDRHAFLEGQTVAAFERLLVGLPAARGRDHVLVG